MTIIAEIRASSEDSLVDKIDTPLQDVKSSAIDDDVQHLPSFLQDPKTEKEAFDYIRDKVLTEVENIIDDVHPQDIESFKRTNEMIARFLYDYVVAHTKESMEATCDQVSQNILETFKWRKSSGLTDTQVTDFPSELYEILDCSHSIYIGHDGRLYLYVTGCQAPNLGEWSSLIQTMFCFAIKKVADHYAQMNDKGMVGLKPIVFLDVSGLGISQCKSYLPFVLSLKSAILNHFPGYYHQVWILGLPKYIESFLWLAMKLIPAYLQRKVKIMNLESAVALVGIQNLPKDIGGEHNGGRFIFHFTQARPSIEEIAKKHGISHKEVVRMKKHVEKVKKNRMDKI